MKDKLRSLLMIVLFVALLVSPSLARAGYYRFWRRYVPPTVPRPDHAAVDVPTVAAVTFADTDVQRGEGRVVIDRAHDNTVDDVELSVLLARFTARDMETVSLTPDDSLSSLLRTAAALVVIAPHVPFSPQEIEVVERFVEQGGRILLVGDPSRYSFGIEYDEYYGEYYIPLSDVTAINSLASSFGLSFADDYIYNTAEHAGNYQYVIVTDFAASPLTAGLEKVIFYAAHSISTGEETLITADERTTSSLREQTGDLATMSLGGDGQVLAVADFTFMTEPYNAAADNNRLIANIADFIAGPVRTYGLTEFPYFFGDQVVVVPLINPSDPVAVPGDAIERLSLLKSIIEATGRTLSWRVEGVEQDIIYFGLYGDVEFEAEVAEILASRGISFTLETVEQERATPTPTPMLTPTPTPTPIMSPTVTPTPEPLRDWIYVGVLGQVQAKEVTLFYQNEENGRQVLIVLAFNEGGLKDAIKRLISGNFDDCLLEEDRMSDPAAIGLAFCPTEYEPSEGPTPTPTPEDGLDATPTPTAGGGVLIVSDDNGEATYEWWTSAYQFYDIVLNAGYDAIVWSTAYDGEVTLDDMLAYSAVIWCTGDYQETEGTPAKEDLDALDEYLDAGGNVILIGAFLGDPEEVEGGLLLDIQVVQGSHPIADGFEADQIIVLERFMADEDYAAYVLGDQDPEEVVFARGPDSEFAGEALVVASEDDLSGSRLILIGFPIYLLPYEDGNQLGTNAVLWMMGE